MKIREENYRWLVKVAGELQKQRGRPVSIDDALSWLQSKGAIADVIGRWTMSDQEYDAFMGKVRGGWKSWKPRFA